MAMSDAVVIYKNLTIIFICMINLLFYFEMTEQQTLVQRLSDGVILLKKP
jgi:hypothetical protein